jgi:hypothetical protein
VPITSRHRGLLAFLERFLVPDNVGDFSVLVRYFTSEELEGLLWWGGGTLLLFMAIALAFRRK